MAVTNNIDLYEVFKSFVPDNFKTRFEIDRTTANLGGQVKIVPNTITIHFKSAEKPVLDACGQIRYRTKRVVFNVYSNRTVSDFNTGEAVCEAIQQNLIGLNNRNVNICSNGISKSVWIISCAPLMDINYLGKTDQGIHMFSMEYKVIY